MTHYQQRRACTHASQSLSMAPVCIVSRLVVSWPGQHCDSLPITGGVSLRNRGIRISITEALSYQTCVTWTLEAAGELPLVGHLAEALRLCWCETELHRKTLAEWSVQLSDAALT